MNAIPEETLKSLKTEQDKARTFVLFHTVQGRWKTDRFTNNQELSSLDAGRTLRVQTYRSSPILNNSVRITISVEGAVIHNPDCDCRNGVVHVIDKALFPINFTAGELLQQNGTFKVFVKGMENLLSENPDRGNSRTFFVPNDEAFKKLDENVYNRLMSSPAYMKEVLRHHISGSILTTKSFQPGLHYDISTLAGTITVVNDGQSIKVGPAEVLAQDILTSNGIIHIIDRVLQLPEQIVLE